MPDRSAPKLNDETVEELFRIVNELLHPHAHMSRPNGLMTHFDPPFDVGKPNQHDTKRDFEHEYLLVTGGMDAIRKLMVPLLKSDSKEEYENRQIEYLEARIDEKIIERAPTAPFEKMSDLCHFLT